MPKPAFGKQANLIIAHPAQKIGGRLDSPAKFHLGFEESACNRQSALDVNGEIGIEERNLSQTVALHQVGDIGYHTFHPVSVKSSLVEDLVRTVVAGIRAADARGIARFAHAAQPLA